MKKFPERHKRDNAARLRNVAIPSAKTLAVMMLAGALALPLSVSAIMHQDHQSSEPEAAVNQRYSNDPDPFVPFIRAMPRAEREAAGREESTEETGEPLFRTPLERLTLSEIRIVGIVISGGRRLAVVEDPRGTFHDLFPGTAVGVNERKVVEILEDHVIIMEKERDTEGAATEVRRILRLEAREDDRGTL